MGGEGTLTAVIARETPHRLLVRRDEAARFVTRRTGTTPAYTALHGRTSDRPISEMEVADDLLGACGSGVKTLI
jgi:hypothetical protein